MRAILQRVSSASVEISHNQTAKIENGWVVFVGIGQEDSKKDVHFLADKTSNLRAFNDEEGKMNLSVIDTKGSVLVISQFTLYGDCRKGRRPSFAKAAKPKAANELYELFVERIKENGVNTKTGTFQATMTVKICNEGPVTFILDSKE